MKRIFVIGLLMTAVLISCNKDDVEKNVELKDGEELLEKERCLELEYPVIFIMPDESTISVNSRKEIRMAIKAWHEANPGVQGKARMQFPVEAKFKNKQITIKNQRQMERLKKACQEGKKPCFTMIYPVTFTMPDGSEISVESRKEIRTAFKAWYEANPGVEEKPALQFPVDVKMKDGTMVTINSQEEMQALKEDCGPGHGSHGGKRF